MTRKPRIGIYPGTFDPITHGHMDIIRRALKVVDKLIIAVAADTTNKKPIFSLEERAEMVKRDVEYFNEQGFASVEAKPFHGLLVNFAREEKATLIIRGVRAMSDFEYEFQMSCINSQMEPTIETVFLPASDKTQFISSRFVKEAARLGGDITQFVSPQVARHLKRHFHQD